LAIDDVWSNIVLNLPRDALRMQQLLHVGFLSIAASSLSVTGATVVSVRRVRRMNVIFVAPPDGLMKKSPCSARGAIGGDWLGSAIREQGLVNRSSASLSAI
jgi:hypothetical protein